MKAALRTRQVMWCTAVERIDVWCCSGKSEDSARGGGRCTRVIGRRGEGTAQVRIQNGHEWHVIQKTNEGLPVIWGTSDTSPIEGGGLR